ncbi:unnamed protein product [Periconia digitata]|uniref:Transmembrane protein n=1 Tax=Periconia digitata TaxID=1303443 RepID=A0A9W4UG48_9PLEO|nr:unnamed protein product [Periconia digitata]
MILDIREDCVGGGRYACYNPHYLFFLFLSLQQSSVGLWFGIFLGEGVKKRVEVVCMCVWEKEREEEVVGDDEVGLVVGCVVLCCCYASLSNRNKLSLRKRREKG